MCQSLMELDHTATDHGWYGWSQGAQRNDYLVYRCGCDGNHLTTYVAGVAQAPDYYEKRCEYIRKCRT